MVGKDDGLGLSLSLRCLQNQNSNPTPPSAPPPTAASPFPLNLLGCHFPFMQHHKSSSYDAFQSSADRNMETRSFFRGIDVNRTLKVTDGDEEIIVSSPNSTLSSLSGKRSSEREENDADERDSSSLEIDDDAEGRKKLRLCKDQAVVLEETFTEHNTLNPKQKMALAKKLNLRPRQVEVWFQNRRARTKLKQTEVDCEYLRRCCENLTNENRRVQKEVNELRALKLSPQFHMNMSPPTTLTMCPQCERLAMSSSSNTTTGGRLATQHRHKQWPMSITSWAGILTPQPLDAHRQGHNSLQE